MLRLPPVEPHGYQNSPAAWGLGPKNSRDTYLHVPWGMLGPGAGPAACGNGVARRASLAARDRRAGRRLDRRPHRTRDRDLDGEAELLAEQVRLAQELGVVARRAI